MVAPERAKVAAAAALQALPPPSKSCSLSAVVRPLLIAYSKTKVQLEHPAWYRADTRSDTGLSWASSRRRPQRMARQTLALLLLPETS